MRVEYLFYTSLGLSIASFLIFAAQIAAGIVRSLRTKSADEGLTGVEPHTINASKMMEDVGELAHAFAKAGPISTSAALSIMFMLIALLSSGLVKVE